MYRTNSGAGSEAGPSRSSGTESGSQENHHPTPAALTSNDLLVLQVRAFLDASEDVDIDVETVEDLMQTITTDNIDTHNDSSGEDEVRDEEDESESLAMEADPELDISILYAMEQEEQGAWTKQEIKHMMYHLKEHGMTSWVKEYVLKRGIPIPKLLQAFGINLCSELRQKQLTTLMYFLRVAMSRELRLRDKLPQYNTVADAVALIRKSKRIVILTGAGISVSCGIPDFRSRDGLYASLKNKGEYELDDPQQMFDINYFRENPSGTCCLLSPPNLTNLHGLFYSFASQIYPSNFVPSACHRFIKLVEDKGQLLRNYTQNIDTLETLAGVRRVLQCHGSFATASCLSCHRRVPGGEIEADILRQRVPLCTVCNPPTADPPIKRKRKSRKKGKGRWDSEDEDESDGPEYPPGIMKPDITFFGEKLTDEFDRGLAEDRNKVDLLLVIGTSLKVSPVSEILSHLPHSVPQILINRTPVRHINPDIVLLGNADEIVCHLCTELGWDLPPPPPAQTLEASSATRLYPARRLNLKRRSTSDLYAPQRPKRVGDSHVWLFDGAEGGKWVESLERESCSRTTVSDDATLVTSSPENSSTDVDVRDTKKARVK